MDLTYHTLQNVQQQLNRIEHELTDLKTVIMHNQGVIMAAQNTTLANLQAAEARRDKDTDAILAVFKSVTDKLNALLASSGDSVPKADLDLIAGDMNAQSDAIEAALKPPGATSTTAKP